MLKALVAKIPRPHPRPPQPQLETPTSSQHGRSEIASALDQAKDAIKAACYLDSDTPGASRVREAARLGEQIIEMIEVREQANFGERRYSNYLRQQKIKVNQEAYAEIATQISRIIESTYILLKDPTHQDLGASFKHDLDRLTEYVLFVQYLSRVLM